MSICALSRPRLQTADEHRAWSWGGAAVIVVFCLLLETVAGLVAAHPVGTWYQSVSKPTWTPPEWVFGPVWTTLFALMAIAGSLVWLERDREEVCCPLTGFGLQLAANLAWLVLFFGLKSPILAFLDVLVLWLLLGLTVVHFFGVSRAAGWLLVPYWIWVTYAAFLNGSILVLSK